MNQAMELQIMRDKLKNIRDHLDYKIKAKNQSEIVSSSCSSSKK